MSMTSLQVELPSFSHSFNVYLPSASTILDLKNEIYRTCAGSPNASGQRVIYKGRVLNDTEVVGQVWKAAEEPHTCHLAVHPSAWTAAPPNSLPSPNITASHQPLPPAVSPSPLRAAAPNAPPAGAAPLLMPPAHATYSYIQYMHSNALRILARQPRLPWPEQLGDVEDARAFAKRGVESTGRGWPVYLNQDFPNPVPEQGADEGVKYTSTHIDNLPYLSLLTPDATPTPVQAQAIKVLSYTFPLLCVYPASQAQHSNLVQVNAIPPRPLAPLGIPVRGVLPQFPIRPLILPLILLTIRTTLLLYFFQPARKPLFGLMVLVWVTWEVAGAVRGALGGENGNGNGDQNNRAGPAENANLAPAGAAGPGPAAAAVGAGAGAGAAPRPGNNNNNAAPQAHRSAHIAVLNHLAHINLTAEAPFVEPNSIVDANTPPPSLVHKIKMFFVLLFLTLHPAIWDIRRRALMAREGRVRDDARTREARALQRERERRERQESRLHREDEEAERVADTPEPLPPKPFWVAEYVQRVRSGDWVDD